MIDEMMKQAWEACNNAYAPYSKFKVGACVLCKDGTMFKGANVENASYGLCNCAERSAIFACYSNGYRKEDILYLGLVHDGDKIITPCGACRQVLSELLKNDTPIVMENKKKRKIVTIKKLLPMAFELEEN